MPILHPNYKPVMKAILSERNIVVVLFAMVLVTFSLAQEDSKKKLTQMTSSLIESTTPVLGQVTAKLTDAEKMELPATR